MNSIKWIFLLFALSACHSKNDPPVDKAKIIGRWQLICPQDSKTDFTKTQELNYSYGRLMATFTYEIDDDNMLISTDKSNGTIYKWHITKLSADSLVMVFADRDYEQKFVRVQQK